LRVIWVLENIKCSKEFYSKFNTLLLLSSVRLWRRNNPSDYCVFYCDAITETFIKEIGVYEFWDEVIVFTPIAGINKEVFWSASKLQILSNQTEPVLILDNDTIVYKNIKPYLDLNKVWGLNLEDGAGYYPTSYDTNVSKLSIKRRWRPNALNVAFLYLPNPEFTKMYAETSIGMMREFTQIGVDNSQYLVFSEQLLLRQLLDDNQIDYGTIISNTEICYDRKWGEPDTNGLWDYNEYMLYMRHYGPYKRDIKEKKLEKEYNFELKSLFFSINFRNFHFTQYLDSNEYPK
jgi:hypothetical protein